MDLNVDVENTFKVTKKTGLIIVDEVNGFCTVGCGPLAPATKNTQIDEMIRQTNMVAKIFNNSRLPIFVFKDSHDPDRPEPPYPPHCIKGTGDDELVDQLSWLETATPRVVVHEKDCINGFVGAITEKGNQLVHWINQYDLERIVIVGICTSICVLDLVVSLLSARNHVLEDGIPLLERVKEIAVFEPACADYDLPRNVAEQLNLPDTAIHEQYQSHMIGLWIMQSRGAVICNNLEF